jgi:hypothetical protein
MNLKFNDLRNFRVCVSPRLIPVISSIFAAACEIDGGEFSVKRPESRFNLPPFFVKFLRIFGSVERDNNLQFRFSIPVFYF